MGPSPASRPPVRLLVSPRACSLRCSRPTSIIGALPLPRFLQGPRISSSRKSVIRAAGPFGTQLRCRPAPEALKQVHFMDWDPTVPQQDPSYLRRRRGAGRQEGNGLGRRRKTSLVYADGTDSEKTTPETSEVVKEGDSTKSEEGKSLEIALAAATAIFFGVANRILYKMALVPLRQYPFFLAQFTTFGYVAVYFSILWARFKSGIVSQEMLEIPKGRFAAMGALEALGLATGMAAATKLPGTMITILSQSFLVWQLLLSSLILKRRYSFQQICGCLLVLAGVVAAVLSSGPAGSASSLQSAGLTWPALMVISSVFPAASSIIKEGVFTSAAKTIPGGSLDIFVVNSFGSAFQALFVFLLLPVLSRIALQIPFSGLPAYFQEGAACLLNMGQASADCSGAPLLPLLYIATNLGFNISLLRLLKKSSAVVTSLSISASVPLTIAAFTLPLPLLGTPQRIGWGFIFGACLLVSGLFVYNSSSLVRHPHPAEKNN